MSVDISQILFNTSNYVCMCVRVYVCACVCVCVCTGKLLVSVPGPPTRSLYVNLKLQFFILGAGGRVWDQD